MHGPHRDREAELDLGLLEALRAVALHGAFTAAAAELGLSQPGLSRRIQRLEREVGVPLIDRDGASPRLTEAGEQTLEFARATLDAWGALRADLRRPATLVGNLRLVASTVPAEHLVPSLVATFRLLHPGVGAQVHQADSGEVPGHLAEGGWDVGFVGHLMGRSDLAELVLAEDEIVLAVPSWHRLAAEDEIELAELADEPLVGREGPSGTQATVEEVLESHGLALPTRSSAIRLGSTHAVVAAILDGLGIGFVSARALQRHPRSRVRGVRLRGVPIERRLLAVYQRDRARTPLVEAFIEHLRSFAERTRDPGVVSGAPPRGGPASVGGSGAQRVGG